MGSASEFEKLQASANQYLTLGFALTLMHCATSDGGCTCGAEFCTSPGKHPRFKDWNKSPIRNADTARKLLRAYPNSNIAMVTGNGVLVLDVDPRNGGDKELNKLQKRYGDLPLGPTVITGGCGRHFYFKSDRPIRSREIAPGVEIKAEGSCVVAPPSLHTSGQHYRWAPGRGLDIEMPPAPPWILERLQSSTPRQRMDTSQICRGFVHGERNTEMTRLAGHLIGKNVSPELTFTLLIAFDQQFNRPPLREAEVQTIVMSIATRELAKRRAGQ